MNPVVEFFNLLDAITMKLLGLHFSIGNIIVLVVFFWFGTLFGRLTRHLTVFRTVLALIIGAVLWDFLRQIDRPIAGAFVIGVIVKHAYIYRGLFSWARDLGDIIFAMRYRRAFEDIRKREEELEELIQTLKRQAREQARTSSQSEQQRQWQEQAKRQRQDGPKPGASGTGGQQYSRQERTSTSNSGSAGGGGREQFLKVMGLDPNRKYSKDELKKAYRKRAKETHPDLGGSEAAFRDVSGAYEWLVGRAEG